MVSPRCSGLVASSCRGEVAVVEVQSTHPGFRQVPMCEACRDAAGRLGLIDRRGPRARILPAADERRRTGRL